MAPGADIVEFVRHDGRPPEAAPAAPRAISLGQLRDRYLQSQGGALEASTLLTAQIHLTHVISTLGAGFPLQDLSAADLQRHIDRRKGAKTRSGTVSPTIIKKEIAGFRAAWN